MLQIHSCRSGWNQPKSIDTSRCPIIWNWRSREVQTTNRTRDCRTKTCLRSTKWLFLVYMQVSAELLSSGIRMKLRWRPREQNVPADCLTNEDFSLFSAENRVPLRLEDIPLKFLEELCCARDEYMAAREGQVGLRLAEGRQAKRQKMASKTAW